MATSKKRKGFLDNKNVKVIAQLVADADTSEALRVKLINALNEASGEDNFFQTMFEGKMSYGECPECSHKNHWLIPETDLNKIDWVTCEQDPEVPENTDKEICTEWEEACIKKKITV